MKKLFLVLLFVPLVSFGQSQMLNGIKLNGPKDFIKKGDYLWTKGNDYILVQSFKTTMTSDSFISKCEKGSRTTKFIRTINQELNGKEYTFCLMKGDNGRLIGQSYVQRGDYLYLITSATYQGELNETNILDKSLENIFYMFGHMIERIRAT